MTSNEEGVKTSNLEKILKVKKIPKNWGKKKIERYILRKTEELLYL